MSNGHSIQVRLMWRDPENGESKQQVQTLPITIGRHKDNTIVVKDGKISRKHVLLEQRGNQVWITNQSSSVRLIVNRQEATESLLQDHDTFELGPVEFTVKIEAHQSASASNGRWMLRWVDPQSNQRLEQVIDSSLSLGRDASTNDLHLDDQKVSRNHAELKEQGQNLILTDLRSANKTRVNDKEIREQRLKEGDTIKIGNYSFTVAFVPSNAPHTLVDSDPRTVVSPQGPVSPPPSAPPPFSDGDTVLGFDSNDTVVFGRVSDLQGPALSLSEFDRPTVSISQLQKSGAQLIETTYLAIGGGLGSFVWVDHLAVFGVDTSQIMSVGLESKPHGRYERLCRNSQIPHHERLRSNSDSCPDNVWGWPGYAVREAWYSLIRGDIANAATVSTQIFIEPARGWTYTPRAGDVFRSIDQESKRIDWPSIWRYGRVKAIRKTDDGRYAIAYSQTSDSQGRREGIILARYVHLAVGYPGVRFLRDLQQYRERTGDFKRVVNAYEEHDHVYQQLERRGGVVMVRGRGIVSSRVVQRVYEARQKNPNISLLHLMRRPIAEGFKYRNSQRETDNHWEFQPFNWPKAAWSGDLREVLEKATPEERAQLLGEWGGTTTADRPDWREIVNEGLAAGWYQIAFGNVDRVEQQGRGLVTFIERTGDIPGKTELEADFIIDGTGLESEIDKHPLLNDLLTHYNLQKNPMGRLHVTNDFEIEGLRNGDGRMYASGVMTLGGPYAPVDSFLGLQYAALRSVDSLVKQRAPGLSKLNGFRSFFQWLRWVRGEKP